MTQNAKQYTIAVIPGDGIGKEVTPWAQQALEKATEGVATFEYEPFDLGAERYLRDGEILPTKISIASRAPTRFCSVRWATRASRREFSNAACCSS